MILSKQTAAKYKLHNTSGKVEEDDRHVKTISYQNGIVLLLYFNTLEHLFALFQTQNGRDHELQLRLHRLR